MSHPTDHTALLSEAAELARATPLSFAEAQAVVLAHSGPNLTEAQAVASAVTTRQVSTHVLVPVAWHQALKQLARDTRIHQSVYLREAVGDVLAKYPSGSTPGAAPAADAERLRSVVFRLSPERLDALAALAARTRVRRSEFLREAIHGLLVKRGALPAAPVPEVQTP